MYSHSRHEAKASLSNPDGPHRIHWTLHCSRGNLLPGIQTLWHLVHRAPYRPTYVAHTTCSDGLMDTFSLKIFTTINQLGGHCIIT